MIIGKSAFLGKIDLMPAIRYVIKRNGATVPFSQDRITNAIYRAAVSVGGRDRETAEKLSQQVVELLETRFDLQQYPTVEEIQDLVEKVLIENGHARVSKAYILYREERNRLRKRDRIYLEQGSEFIPWKKIWSVLDWAADHELSSIEKINHRISQGESVEIISESEEAFAQDVQQATRMIEGRKKDLKLVIISGPSSSGKTTTTARIAQALGGKGLRFIELNLDNYYYDIAQHPRDEFGDYDFETPQALDIGLINQHLHQLLEGRKISIPHYNFKTGRQYPDQTPMQVHRGEILLIDSLYGLYPPLSDGIFEDKVKIYIEPLLQIKTGDGNYIRWTDIRLMRRMLRDAIYRSYNYEKTLTHWHYVRAGELRSIIPYSGTADMVINSGMPYEIPLYKPKLYRHFIEWEQKYRDDPLRQDAFMRASRIRNMLQGVTPISDDSLVPKDSVIREFIGGLKVG